MSATWGALTGWPVAGFHNRTVPPLPSVSALASSLPSGLNATPYTLAVGAGVGEHGGANRLGGGRVPQPHGAVGAGGGQQLAVWAERHPVHDAEDAGAGVGEHGGADRLAGGRVPQPDRPLAVSGRQQLAVWAEGHL